MSKYDPNAPVTNKVLDQATEHLGGLMIDLGKKMKQGFSIVNSRLNKVETRLNKVETELHEVKTEVKFMHQDINDLKADTPTQKEFDTLKAKVDLYHPTA